MGRIARPRRGGLDRAALMLILVLVVPAAGFSALGWRSIRREHDVRTREWARDAEAALGRRAAAIVDALERVRAREALRDPTDWQDEVLPVSTEESGLSFQPSPLVRSPAEPLVRGWFRWELLDGEPMGARPEVFPSGDEDLVATLFDGFGPGLAARLVRAPTDPAWRAPAAIVRRYPLRFLAANEERGRIQEARLELARRGTTQRTDGVPESSYLDSFDRRTRGGAEIDVHLTAMRWLIRSTAGAPHLVAWRLVHVPAAHADRREVRGDRRWIQGVVVDASRLLPTRFDAEGSIEIGPATAFDGRGEIWRDDLIARLDAEIAREDPDPTAAGVVERDDFALIARVVPGAIDGAWAKMRGRFLLQLAGLGALLIGGLVLLVRLLRRERALVRRKEDFVAAVTHELRTPLTGIRMYAEMLHEGWVESPEAADRYAARILGETERLGGLVDQVLDLAALERGVARIHAGPGDLGATVEEAVGLLRPRADEVGATLDVQIEPDLPPVVFDPRLVKPMVLNLVDNALKYGARGEDRTVRIRVARSGERTEVRVSDRGPGIDPELRRELFRPFRRAEGELTRGTPGVGIGLALVKRYADAHRARVIVDSEPGRGTSIAVRFR